MKTSTKLILGLLSLLLVALVGFDAMLKAEFQKTDFSDPYVSYRRQAVNPFRVVRIEGNPSELVAITQAPDFAVRLRTEKGIPPTHRLQGDTLVVSLPKPERRMLVGAGEAFGASPKVFVQAPTLLAVDVRGASVKLIRWKAPTLTALVRDSTAGLLLAQSQLGQLNATVQTTGLLQTAPDVRVNGAVITVQDQARFRADADQFGSLKLLPSPTASIQLPGGLLRKVTY